MVTPVAVEVWRGERVESRHRVRACVVDAGGRLVLGLGDLEEPVFPRSAVKPFQALALVESGAADRFQVSDAELALACASHGGEPGHVAAVEGWLARLSLTEAALACGPHPPMHAASAAALVRAAAPPRRVHNNCSGKHTGMLAAALQLGAATDGYQRASHPVQRHVTAALAELASVDTLHAPGIDGCGLPNFPLPLQALALAAARLAAPGALPPARGAALDRIAVAMMREPAMVAGSGRCCTALMQAVPGLVAKTGAEGVYLVASRRLGLGLALKAEDGATRAAEVAALALLRHLSLLDGPAIAGLERFARPTLRNFAGDEVGRVAPASGWPGR